jgi:hypothetical protein
MDTGIFFDSGSGDFFTPGSGMEKNPDHGSAINIIPDHICKSLVTISWFKNAEHI